MHTNQLVNYGIFGMLEQQHLSCLLSIWHTVSERQLPVSSHSGNDLQQVLWKITKVINVKIFVSFKTGISDFLSDVDLLDY